MKEKIYEKVKEDSKQAYAHYLKAFGIIDDEKSVKSETPKKNIDLMILLSKLGLIESNSENIEIINEFHDYLFKLGIEMGVGHGKRMVIDAIKSRSIDFKKLMEMNPQEFVAYNLEPPFIADMKEALANEK
mgnify:CR=1 FL=1|jgi:hypothetical protein